MVMKQKSKIQKKKNQNGRLKKTEIFKTANSQKNFVKISWIGPWVSRVDWCKGHWCGSTHMVVRLSDISSKTGKKLFFCVLGCFWAYVRQPHDHIGWAKSMPFASINSTNPSTNTWNFHQKMLRIGDFFASPPWKSCKVTWVSRMGRNFDDYPGLQQKMEWSLFQDSEEIIHSAEKKLPHMKAFSLCIDKKNWKTQ